MQTPREIVQRALTFQYPERLPQQLWYLPWIDLKQPEEAERLRSAFPSDIVFAPAPYEPSPRAKGDLHMPGVSYDEWGCRFDNLQEGIIGEVRDPILTDLEEARDYQPPYEILPSDWDAARRQVNEFCAGTDRFVLPGSVQRPWERYQFLRGTMEAFCDFADPEEAGILELLEKIHQYYLRELEFWVSTDVDGIFFIDDWGSQQSLLISPDSWRQHFRPLYAEYARLARDHGKFVFMHSDGEISAIYPDLIELGVNALNSQLFVMDIEELGRRHRGQITFWGEIDRQQILIQKDPEKVREAVRRVARNLYDPSGGIIIQCEITPGMITSHADIVIEEWNQFHKAARNTMV